MRHNFTVKTLTNPWLVISGLIFLAGVTAFHLYERSFWESAQQKFEDEKTIPKIVDKKTVQQSIDKKIVRKIASKRTVADVVTSVGPSARARLASYFEVANTEYPPQHVTLLALKDSAQLELWVGPEQQPTFIRTYPIQALSGVRGPKLREGDRQVPEGIYRIEGLNPNSSYHLSMKLNFPNAFDLRHAQTEGRTQPGSDIFIHGKAVSIGCLAMGDESIEELFVLAADVGRENIKVVIAPSDPRRSELSVSAKQAPTWVASLYQQLNSEFRKYARSEH